MTRRSRLASLAVAAAASLAIGATSANAAISVSNSNPFDGQQIQVSVSSPPAGTTAYALAECDTTDATPANWGRDCNRTDGSFKRPGPFTGPAKDRLTVWQEFDNVSFVPNQSPKYGPDTVCDGETWGDPCAVVVSWYSGSGRDLKPLGAERALLRF